MNKISWNNLGDRNLYNDLFYGDKNQEELSDEELDFVHTMYHLEEFACGLDGV